MKNKTKRKIVIAVYIVSALCLIPVIIDSFIDGEYRSSLLTTPLLIFGTWGLIGLLSKYADKKS